MKKRIIFVISVSFFIIGCSQKDVIINKPAMFWYQNIFQSIRENNLDKADDYFVSLQSEHTNSPLIKDAILILGNSHLYNNENILAEFYFSEYIKRFGDSNNLDYINYLRLRARFFSFQNNVKDQQFLIQTTTLIHDFMDKYPNSRYINFVHDMELKIALGQNELNKKIAHVYDKLDKDKAKNIYLDRIDNELESKTEPRNSKTPWYMLLLNW